MMRRCLLLLSCLLCAPAATSAEPAAPVRLHFQRDIVPVLTRAGCNSGACHGSFQGRGGFRLSLLGFDPQADQRALVFEARGRRLFPAAPAESLLLRKATGAMAHGGRKRFETTSESYRLLHDWIARGHPGPRTEDAQLLRLEIAPQDAILQPGQRLDLQAWAHWSDGVRQDIRPWAQFESSNEHTATVSSNGQIAAKAPGRAALTVRHLGLVAAVIVTVPYPEQVQLKDWPTSNWADGLIRAEWEKLHLTPAPPTSDAEFFRRVHLDLIGTLPTPEEVRRFLSSTATDKRAKVINALLERPEYVDYWSLKWSDLLRAHRRALGEKGLRSFNGWLRQALRENWPVPRLVQELLTAQGNLYASGPAAYFFIDQTPQELAETTAQVFLGVRLQCAKCHHHPFEVWSQDDYHGLAAFFARVQRKNTGDAGRFGGAQSISLAASGTVTHPDTGLVVPPRLFGTPLTLKAEEDPRQVLARWITDSDNPYFARSIVNRYWGYLFGRGLIEPLDDLRATNPPSHPALLDALTRDFVKAGYSLKHLLRTLCNARVYQLACQLNPQRDMDGMFYTHRRPRRLPAEVLLDAVNQACGVHEPFPNLPAGARAIALPDPAVASVFLDTFGRPRRTSACECERSSRPDLRQVLHLANGDKLHQKLTSPQGRVAQLLAGKQGDAAIIEELYLATLSRPPAAEELATALQLVREAPSRREGTEDLLWALLNCAEFCFQR